jgi:tetratricopeptide (TPR) repeat protein
MMEHASADALHLRGLMAYRRGERSQARALLRQAAESPETTALYLLSYAELCCKPIDRRAAVELARRAVALDGTLALGWDCLGRMLLELRQLDESQRCFERALKLDPRFWQARANLALVQARRGDAPGAIAVIETLLLEQPRNAEARDVLALLLQDQGRYEEALRQAERSAAERPDSLELSLRPAEIELQQGRHQAALERLAVVEESWPGEIKLKTLQAHLLRLVDQNDEAVALCRGAIAAGLESPELLRAYGLALQLAGQESLALQILDQAATNSVDALSDKGVLLTHLGRFADACETFDQALLREPSLADAWYNKANAKTHTPEDPDIAAMERLLAGHCSSRDRLLLHFALGKAHMDAGAAAVAMTHWHDANRMKRAAIDYNADASTRQMAMAAARLEVDAPNPAGFSLSELPVFVVGMPRSGSSLVEQILASHPEIHGAGELLQLRALFERAVPGAESAIAERVLDRLRRRSPDARRIVDKDLANFLHLGLIHRILPRARIIHCRRDPLDTCFSAYTRLFVGNLGFTYDLVELGRYYRDYHALMAHWRRVLPSGVFLDIDYESLVADPRSETRRMLDFIGLPWNDACENFFTAKRLVSTASSAQVRRPIYRSSIGRAKMLRSHLQPLIEALGDLASAG